jgi:outer membrane protein OmpU
MNNLKKLGLTALAGSLVATSVSAGDLSVSGGASLDYSSSSEAVGNGWSMGDSVNFSGSGDVNGMDVTLAIELDGGTYDDYSLKIDTGDMGAVTFSGASVGAGGLNNYGNVVPTAYEEVYDATDGNDYGITGNMSSTGSFSYNGTFGNLTVSAMWNPASVSSSSMVLQYADLIDGLTIGAGQGEVDTTQDEESVWIKYVMGGATMAWQRSEVDFSAATSRDEEGDHYGISFAVNEDLTVSAGRQEVDFSTSGNEDEESSGVSASYTMGGLTIAGHANSTDSQNGVSGQNETSKSINFAFAF